MEFQSFEYNLVVWFVVYLLDKWIIAHCAAGQLFFPFNIIEINFVCQYQYIYGYGTVLTKTPNWHLTVKTWKHRLVWLLLLLLVVNTQMRIDPVPFPFLFWIKFHEKKFDFKINFWFIFTNLLIELKFNSIQINSIDEQICC